MLRVVDILNAVRYRKGRRITRTIAIDWIADVKIIANTLRSDGQLTWQVTNYGMGKKLQPCDIVTGTPEQLERHFAAMRIPGNWQLMLRRPDGPLWIPVSDWFKQGPGDIPEIRPLKLRVGTGEEVPVWFIMPLRYHNSKLSRLLIWLGILWNPWEALE